MLQATNRFSLRSGVACHYHSEKTENNPQPIRETAQANAYQDREFCISVKDVIEDSTKSRRPASRPRDSAIEHIDEA